MKKLSALLTFAVLLFFVVSPLQAKGKPESFPGGTEGTVKSNAPSTGTQMKGKERATEVGKGKEKGLHKEVTSKPAVPETPKVK